MKIINWTVIIVSLFLSLPAFGEGTTMYFNGGVVSLEPPKITISYVYGVALTNINPVVKSNMRANYIYVPHTIENLSNVTTKIDIDLKPIDNPKDWSVSLIEDTNKDGKHQKTEIKAVPNTVELSELSTLKVFVVFKVPENAVSGETAQARLRVSTQIKDGKEYMGFNGVTYGGEDMEESLDTVTLE